MNHCSPVKGQAAPEKGDVYERLAAHVSMTGIPLTDALVNLVKAAFDTEEARIAMCLNPSPVPLTTESLEKISQRTGLAKEETLKILDRMVEKKLIFCSGDGSPREYALHYAGFGFPQSFFWNGDMSETAKQMSRLVGRYFKDTTKEIFGGTPTKPYRYIPIHQSIDPDTQAVMPHDMMESVIDHSKSIAVAHCPCRVQAAIWGKSCEHSLEVCLKFDEMAEYVIDRKIGRMIDKAEAKRIIEAAADEGLVHFVDNTASEIKHNCNCCGCACWNVGSIKRRKIPRDELMAVYYIRKTDEDECVDCGECADICPVKAVSTDDGIKVDENWCIGCGVCARKCPADAISMVRRQDLGDPPENFTQLYEQIARERKNID